MQRRLGCWCRVPWPDFEVPGKIGIGMLKVLFITVIIWPVTKIVSQDPNGFLSLDCGGESQFTDPETHLEWLTDEDFLDSATFLFREGIAVPANVELNDSTASTRDNALEQRTAMAFIPRPEAISPSKYCYVFNVNISKNYLIRAMFPNKKLTALRAPYQNVSLSGHTTRFYFTVDSTFVATVQLHEEETQTVELVASPLDERMHICVVPLEDRSSMPAISSIELRGLPREIYLLGRNVSASGATPATVTSRGNSGFGTTYLMTVSRLNYGANESAPAMRYPFDPYDRLWYSARGKDTTDPAQFESRNTSFIDYGSNLANVNQPAEVSQTCWEGIGLTSNISLIFDIAAARARRPIPTFYLNMFVLDVNPGTDEDVRVMNVYLEDTGVEGQWKVGVPTSRDTVLIAYTYRQIFSSGQPVFRLTPAAGSTRPALVNAIEIFGEFEAGTRRTADADASAVKNFSSQFRNIADNFVDIAGDPCLPVPWNWLVCSIEIPPRITQINLTSSAVNGTIPADFGSLDRLTVLDLSNNSFSGMLPQSLARARTLRQVNLQDNFLTGDLSLFAENEESSTLFNLERVCLRNNSFTGNLSALFRAFGLQSTVQDIDISVNGFDGSIPEVVEHLTSLEYLNLSHNHLAAIIPPKLFKLPKLTKLNLERNMLTGLFPDEVWSENVESNLQIIDVSDNSLTELNLTTWARIVANSSFDAFQQQLSLVGNDITNVILPPDELNVVNQWSPAKEGAPTKLPDGYILLGRNPWCDRSERTTLMERFLCRSNPSEDFWHIDADGRIDTKALVITLVVSGVAAVLLAGFVIFFIRRLRRRMKVLSEIQSALAKEDVRPPVFDYDVLKRATKSFSKQNELGRGGFGSVYKAELPDKSVVPVKLLFKEKQNIDEFLKEMVAITGIKHRNLLQLRGCSVRDQKRILVYEYAEHGNLADALWGKTPLEIRKDKSCVLSWEQRVKIILGVAKGLAYLHEELQPKIIHRDIKAQNILLDKAWNAKIGDFGLARTIKEDFSQEATKVGGTLGYIAPEYATQGFLSEKLDVFSFGILLLEIVSGRPCIDHAAPKDQLYLGDWARQMNLEGRVADVAEDFIAQTAPSEEIELMLKTALLCTEMNHDKRPSISGVLKLLLISGRHVGVEIVEELKAQRVPIKASPETVTRTMYPEIEDLDREHRTLL